MSGPPLPRPLIITGGEMIKYGFTKELDMSFDGAVEAITAALKKEGFGILTKIDVKEKFKEKLGIDFRNYVILV